MKNLGLPLGIRSYFKNKVYLYSIRTVTDTDCISQWKYTAWNLKRHSIKVPLAKCRNFNLHAKLQHINNKKVVTKQIKHNFFKLSTLLNRSVQPKIYKVPVHFFYLFSAQLSLKVLLEYSPSRELNLSLHQFHQSQHCN